MLLNHFIFRLNCTLVAEIACHPAFKFPITFAECKPLVGVSEQIETLTQMIWYLFSVLGIMLLMTAFLHLVFRFLLNILCSKAGLGNGFFRSCKKPFILAWVIEALRTQNAPGTFRPFLFWILNWKNREKYQDFFKTQVIAYLLFL